jgi:hypothetical protein
MSVQDSHSATVPVMTMDRGDEARIAAPMRWWARIHGSMDSPSDLVHVAKLAIGTNGYLGFNVGRSTGDDMGQPSFNSTNPQRGHHLPGQAAFDLTIANGNRHEAKRRCLYAALMTLHGADHGAVITVRQVLHGAIPANGNTPTAGNNSTLIQQQHVVLREVFSDLSRVPLRDLVVEDELGPLHPEGSTRLILEVWALIAGNNIHDREGRGCGSVTSPRLSRGEGAQSCHPRAIR